MSDDWLEVSLGDLTASTRPICYGVLKPGPHDAGGVPLIRIQDMERDAVAEENLHHISASLDREFARSRLKGGEVLLSIQGTVGRVAICPPSLAGANISRTVAVIEPDARLSAQFLRLYLQAVALKAGFDDAGSTRASLNISTIRDMRVPVPPLQVQRRIVDLLAHLDNHLENVKAELETSRRLVRVLRKEAFRPLGSQGSRPAGEVFDMLLGRQKSERQSVGEHVIPYMRAANISEDGIKIDDVQCMNFSPSEQAKYCLQPGDILLVEGGTVGLCAQWEGQVSGAVGFDKHVIRVRPRAELSTASYALHWAKWSRESGAFDAQATGITIKALGFGRASSMPVPVLGLAEQSSLVAPLDVCESTIRNLTAEVEATRTLRGALLSELLAGATELPVSYDSLLPEVA